MFASLPLFCFILIFLCFYQGAGFGTKRGLKDPYASPGQQRGWRTCFLFAAILWGVLVFASTEFLSFFHGITFSCILGFWILATLIAGLVLYTLIKKEKRFVSFDFSFPPVPQVLLLSGITFIIIIVGLIALVAPPSTWDSMTYHMSRVVHWIQNKSVASYPTNIIRQLTYTPWAEFAIMHLQILSHSDRFASLIQWFSMIGSIIGVSLIAKQLGADQQGQILTSVAASTIPMGILQGSSTQNDYTVAFWLVCLVYFLLLLKSDLRLTSILAAGASLGLALLTKGTAYPYAFPFLIGFVFAGFQKYRWRLWKPFLIILSLTLILNAGYYARNFDLRKTIFAANESPRLSNEIWGVRPLLSNFIRNLGLHLGTPFENMNTVVEKGVHGLHTLMRIDMADPRTTFGKPFAFPGHPFHEDHAGNLLHLVLIVSCIFLLFMSKNLEGRKNTIKYFWTVTATFLLFSLILKWQPWGTRLQLPIFVLYAPFVGIVMSRARDAKAVIAVGIICLLYSAPWLFYNQSRPLIGDKNIFNTKRIDQYFANNPGFQYSYESGVNYTQAQGCSHIGLALTPDSWEYPLWALLKPDNNPDIRLEHINVQNASSVKMDRPLFSDFNPCAIISDSSNDKTKIILGNTPYVKTKQLAFLSVFMKDPTGMLAQRSLIYHFNKIIEYSRKTNTLLKKGTVNGVLIPEATQTVFNLRRKQLQEARQVDIRELNQLHDGLGERFANYLVKGLERLMVGYATGNQQSYGAGQALLNQWNSWISNNKDMLQKAFQEGDSPR